MPDKRGRLLVGTSGWIYRDWWGPFYPQELNQRKSLEFYCQHFDTVEVNSTYYHTPRGTTCEGWRSRTPEGFAFTLKMTGLVTHKKRLRDCADELAVFMAAAAKLEGKLSCVLHQLPPSLHGDIPLLEGYLDMLGEHPGRHVVEFRHESWLTDDVLALLRERGVGLCIVSGPQLPVHLEATAAFCYFRFHGPTGCDHLYSAEELGQWAGRIAPFLSEGLDCYCYFNNDVGANAVRNARQLRDLLEGPATP